MQITVQSTGTGSPPRPKRSGSPLMTSNFDGDITHSTPSQTDLMMRDIFIQPEPSSSTRPYLPYLSDFVPPGLYMSANTMLMYSYTHTDLTKTLKSRPNSCSIPAGEIIKQYQTSHGFPPPPTPKQQNACAMPCKNAMCPRCFRCPPNPSSRNRPNSLATTVDDVPKTAPTQPD